MGGAQLTCPEGTASSAGGVQGYCTWLWVVFCVSVYGPLICGCPRKSACSHRTCVERKRAMAR